MTSAPSPTVRPAVPAADPLAELWRRSLVLPDFDDPVPSALRELSLYFAITEQEAEERCRGWERDSTREWSARDRSTAEGLRDFYLTTQSWIFDTVWYHAQQYHGSVPAESVMIAERVRRQAPGCHLDFGSGPGGTSLFFHNLGWQVSLADVSITLLRFARWRFELRGIDAAFYDLNDGGLPAEHFDLITACDVMVHVPDPVATLRMLHRALKPHGLLIFNVDASPGGPPWHLYPYAYPVLRPVRGIGFRRLPRLAFFHVYRKINRHSGAGVPMVFCYDAARYNWVTAGLGRAARRFRGR